MGRSEVIWNEEGVTVNIDTGELWTDEELQDYYGSHTTSEIKEFESRMVQVNGEPDTIAELSAKLASHQDNLHRIQEEARNRARKKLR